MKVLLRYKSFLGLAILHLILVTCGTAYIDVSQLPLIGPTLGMYGQATGSSDGYGFFSPGIEGQMTVWFDVTDGQGGHRKAYLPTDENREASIRVGDIIDQFSEDHDDQEAFERSMTASFAAKISQLYPDAKRVSVHIDKMDSISMEEFRSGKRLSWHPLYQADYIPPKVTP